jgi:hypothetical protein
LYVQAEADPGDFERWAPLRLSRRHRPSTAGGGFFMAGDHEPGVSPQPPPCGV